MAESLEQRVSELEQRVAVVEDVKGELAHWIGEAKKFERFYRSASEQSQRHFDELRQLRKTPANEVAS